MLENQNMDKEYVTKDFCKEISKNMIEKIDKLDRQLENQDIVLDEIKVLLATLPKQIFDEADKKYASKTTEKVVNGLLVLVLVSVATAIINLVIK